MKIWQWLMGGFLALALSSCGIFFAPLEGRWNPLDPNFGDGYTETSLYPTLDGYVESAMTTLTDGTETMLVGMSSFLALMKFDTAEIPEDIPHAELHLYLTDPALTPAACFRVRLILQDWDSTVGYVEATTAGFATALASPSVSVAKVGSYVWDVTALLQSVAPASFKGLLVEAVDMSAMTAAFRTTEYPTEKPHLVVWTR